MVCFRRRPGFTIIELLVVISIILILAGIAVPVISGMLRVSGVAECANNLRQIGLTLLTEVPKRRGVFPPGGNNPAELTASFLSLFPDPRILVCPAADTEAPTTPSPSYMYVGNLNPTYDCNCTQCATAEAGSREIWSLYWAGVSYTGGHTRDLDTDWVSLMPGAVAIQDHSFESSTHRGASIVGWNRSSSSGVVVIENNLDAVKYWPDPPLGAKFVRIATTSWLAQNITISERGQYTISFYSTRPLDNGTPTQIRLLLGGNQLMEWAPPSNSWARYTTNTGTLEPGNYELRFQGLSSSGNTGLDYVQMSGIDSGESEALKLASNLRFLSQSVDVGEPGSPTIPAHQDTEQFHEKDVKKYRTQRALRAIPETMEDAGGNIPLVMDACYLTNVRLGDEPADLPHFDFGFHKSGLTDENMDDTLRSNHVGSSASSKRDWGINTLYLDWSVRWRSWDEIRFQVMYKGAEAKDNMFFFY
jgi:prepilin-type N-terminal cleavage/methylation domain-containing protein